MARLIDVDIIRLGGVPERSVLWEEWQAGTGCTPVELVKVVGDGFWYRYLAEGWPRGCDHKHRFSDLNYRYWDSEPTLEEREAAKW